MRNFKRITSAKSSILRAAARIEVLERRVLLDAIPLASEFRVNTFTLEDQKDAAVASADNGNFVVVWSSLEQDGSLSGVFGQRYNADAVPQGAEFRVNTYTTQRQEAPSVAMDFDGDFVVAWHSYQQTNGWDVYAQRYNAAGVKQGSEFRVNTYTTSHQTYPSVAMYASGFVVAWQSAGQDGDGYGVYAQRYNSLGAAQGSEFQVHQVTANRQELPSVAANGFGEFVIAWSHVSPTSGFDVLAREYSSTGVPDLIFQVNQFTTGVQATPAVAFNDDGKYVIAWQSDLQDGSGYGVYARRFNPAVFPPGSTEFRVNTFTTGTQTRPSVGIDDNGDFAIAWRSNAQDGSGYGVYGQRFKATGAPDGAEFRVNTFTTDAQELPKLAMRDDGDFIAVWQSKSQDGSNYGIYAQRYGVGHPAGTSPELPYIAAGSEFRVNTYTTLTQADAAIASDADGDFVVAWRSRDQDGSLYGIYAQRYDRMGVTQGSEFRVNTFTTGNQTSPAIAMDADGDFVIAWESAGQDSGTYGVYFQRFNASGAAQGGEIRANTFTPNDQIGPAVGMDDAGNFVIAWNSFAQDGSNWGVYAQRYSASGVAQGGEFRVNTFTTGSQTSPAVGFDASGNFVIAWESFLQEDPTTLGIYAQRYDNAGVAQGGEIHVNSFTTGDQRYPAVAVADAGKFVITWQSTGQDGSSNGVYAQRFSASGVHEGPEFRANTFTPNSQEEPSIAMDAAGNFLIAWTSGGHDPADGIFAQRYDAAGVPQGGEFRVNTFTTNDQIRPAMAMDADGDAVIAWQSTGQDGSGFGIYAQRYAVIPAVTSSSFHIATLPQRLTFTFDRPMSGSFFSLDNVVVQTLLDGSIVAPSAISYDAPSNTATVSFNTPVPNGNLRAVLLGNGFISTAGVPLAGSHYFNFFFQRGDANQDRRVDLNDFNTLAANFGQSPRDFTQGDFDYDTIVNLNDFNLLASAFGTAVPAYPTPGAAEFRVNTTTSGSQLRGNLAVDALGNSVLVWASPGQGGDFMAVYAQRYDPSGNPLGSEFKVNTTGAFTTTLSAIPRVAMEDNGDFVVVWGPSDSNSPFAVGFSAFGIRGQRYNAAGLPLGGEFVINISSAPVGAPYVAMDFNGDFVAVWESYDGVEARRYNTSGVPQGAPFTISEWAGSETIARTPHIAMDDFGDFVVVWNNYGPFPTVSARRYSAAGAPQGAEIEVATGSGPRVAMDGDGDFVVTYTANGPGDNYGVFASRFDASGVRRGPTILVNQFTPNGQTAGFVSSDSEGNFLVTWISDQQDGSLFGVYARLFSSEGQPLTDEFRANSFTTSHQTGASGYLGDDGQVIIRWHSLGQDGDGWGIYARRFATLPPDFGEFLVSRFARNEQPATAMKDNGDFVVVWAGNSTMELGLGIRARRYDAAGTPLALDFSVNTYTTGNQTSPAIAMDADGNFVIAWQGEGAGDSFGIFARRYNSAGVAQGGEFRVNTVVTNVQSAPVVAMDSDGEFFIAWTSNQDGTSRVYAQRYDAAGISQGPEFLVSTNTAFAASAPSIGMDDDGDFVIAWTTPRTTAPTTNDVYAQRFNAAGISQGPEFRVNTGTTNDQEDPSVAMDSDGDFVIAWESNYGSDGSGKGIYGQRFNAAGIPQGAQFRVNTFTFLDQIDPAVAMSPAGEFIITWAGNGPGDSSGVFMQRYDVAGVAQGAQVLVNTLTTFPQVTPCVAMDADGDFVIAWTNAIIANFDSDIYARLFAGAGGASRSDQSVRSSNSTSSEELPSNAKDFLLASLRDHGRSAPGLWSSWRVSSERDTDLNDEVLSSL